MKKAKMLHTRWRRGNSGTREKREKNQSRHEYEFLNLEGITSLAACAGKKRTLEFGTRRGIRVRSVTETTGKQKAPPAGKLSPRDSPAFKGACGCSLNSTDEKKA